MSSSSADARHKRIQDWGDFTRVSPLDNKKFGGGTKISSGVGSERLDSLHTTKGQKLCACGAKAMGTIFQGVREAHVLMGPCLGVCMPIVLSQN